MSIGSRTRRMMATLPMLSLALALPAMAADIPSEVTLFKNVKIYDGRSEKLLEGQEVLVVNNLIKKIGKNIPTSGTYEIDAKTGGVTKKTVSFGGAQGYTVYTAGDEAGTEKKQVKVNVIDGGGRTLMPGLPAPGQDPCLALPTRPGS